METQEEVVGSKDQAQINKGKRTKRQRPQSPLAQTMASSSSSTGDGFGGDQRASDNSGGLALPTTSLEFTQSTEEEEDMANCLILLAKGRQTQKSSELPTSAAITATKAATAGFYFYQCKTCDRCFPSFQALGGHRASHKKPKAANAYNLEEKRVLSGLLEEEEYILNNNNNNNTNTILSLQISNRSASCNNTNKLHKVHECSVCGAEFSSGQALGGHMRRHRTFATNNSTTMSMASISSNDQSRPEAKKPRNILSLDLNLPAPDDDFRESKFPFASKEQVLVFSASPLVDCHY